MRFAKNFSFDASVKTTSLCENISAELQFMRADGKMYHDISIEALLLPIWTDEEVVKNTYIQGVHNEENCKERIERMVKISLPRNNIGPYAIFESKNLIGIVGAARNSSFEYGLFYHLGKEY